MTELVKTIGFCIVAAALVTAALVVDPGASASAVFNDQGEMFYPQFTDPQAPKAIEIVSYNEDTATATPLKVEFVDNQWVIPSHHNYPADAANRLADTAAALMELRKDILVSERVDDHEDYAVIDPLAEDVTSLVGRGQRVTLRDGEGEALADFVIGKNVEGKPGYRYMRAPSQRRVYAVKTDARISVDFADWIETDLLKLNTFDIKRIEINNYAVQEDGFGRAALQEGEQLVLQRNEDNEWRLGDEEPDSQTVSDLTRALDQLRIVSVQPKPDILTEDLKAKGTVEPSAQAAQALVEKGFYLSGDGQIFGNEGEIIVDAKNGLRYTLRFGEVAGSSAASEDDEAGGENRYVFIAVNYDEERAKEYAGEDAEPDEEGRELGQELSDRFADWYYVISGSDFDALRPTEAELLESKESDEDEES